MDKKNKFSIRKTLIEKRIKQKKDLLLVKTIIQLKKNNPLLAKELSRPRRKWSSINLKEIADTKGDVLIVGKVLSAGDLKNGRKIVAWSASKKALEKIKESKGNFVTIPEEIKKNPKLEGYNLLR